MQKGTGRLSIVEEEPYLVDGVPVLARQDAELEGRKSSY
jgi:hypothetical protein